MTMPGDNPDTNWLRQQVINIKYCSPLALGIWHNISLTTANFYIIGFLNIFDIWVLNSSKIESKDYS